MLTMTDRERAIAALEAGCWVERSDTDGTFSAWWKRDFAIMFAGHGKTPIEAMVNAAEWGGWTPTASPSPLTLEMVEKALRTMMAQGWLVPNLHTDEDGIIDRLRQQMGGE